MHTSSLFTSQQDFSTSSVTHFGQHNGSRQEQHPEPPSLQAAGFTFASGWVGEFATNASG
jgi:hypothetical protein